MNDIKTLILLGRQPALGVAELERLYGAENLKILSDNLAGLSIESNEIDFNRLGGSIKMLRVIDTLHQANWTQIEKKFMQVVPAIAKDFEPGKITLGISNYGVNAQPRAIQGTALKLKKVLRNKTDQSVRVIPNQESALSTAQVIHNKLTGPRGIEAVALQVKDIVYLAQTVAEQDIEAYTKRDQARPKRDARVGMLPPKLAQVIINIATGDSVYPSKNANILDPFCGTGVVLQESLLMNFGAIGTDIEPRMIEYSEKNIDWLNETHLFSGQLSYLDVGDATTHEWRPDTSIDAVACEGYLGQPFSAFPAEEKLRDVMQTCNQIMKGFLKNIASQIESGTPLCVALPAWHRPNGKFEHLKLLDSLEELGYNRVSFVHVRTEDLLYYRPDQVVARELLVITRK